MLFDGAGLLHTRLRIIDLSPTGDQPMSNETGDVWVVFNGEIYNHREVRRTLERSGHSFRGNSDTEILPHLYEDHGRGLFSHLRGMFTVAILDLRRRRLLLGRDRFGIKPLFIAKDGPRVGFASEINALRHLLELPAEHDEQAISDFAAVLYVPAPQTVYRNVEAVMPGQLIEVTASSSGVEVRREQFHAWAPEPDWGMSVERAVARVAELVDTGVASQLESDVSLGAMLSGGIDSSVVCEAASRGLGGGLQTFNVRQEDPAYDESDAAMVAASSIGSSHRTLDMGATSGDWDSIVSLFRHFGQPFADTSVFAARLVCKAMREYVTVALSGDGGDEVFGGYDVYWRLRSVARAQSVPSFLWRLGAPLATQLARRGVVRPSLGRRIVDLTDSDDVGVMQTFFSWLRASEHAELLLDPANVEPPRRWFERTWSSSSSWDRNRLERLTAHAVEINLRLVLPNDYLFKADAASMRESLEVRVPLLDEQIVAFGLTLPHALRVEGRRGKRVLRSLASSRLPSELVERPKQGFTVPVDRWVDDNFKSTARDVLRDGGSPVAGYFARDVYEPWVDAFATDRTVPEITRAGLYQRVMMLLALDTVLRE